MECLMTQPLQTPTGSHDRRPINFLIWHDAEERGGAFDNADWIFSTKLAFLQPMISTQAQGIPGREFCLVVH